jgi:hypothetical protein
LFDRINQIPIRVPSLAERAGEDIELLVRTFEREYQARVGGVGAGGPLAPGVSGGGSGIHAEVIEAMKHDQWKGNVRELRKVVEYLLASVDGEVRLDSARQAFMECTGRELRQTTGGDSATMKQHILEHLNQAGREAFGQLTHSIEEEEPALSDPDPYHVYHLLEYLSTGEAVVRRTDAERFGLGATQFSKVIGVVYPEDTSSFKRYFRKVQMVVRGPEGEGYVLDPRFRRE